MIAIDEDSRVWVDKQQVDVRELEYTIRELRDSNPKGEIVVQADNESDAGTLDAVMQAVTGASPGSNVNVSTELD